MVIAQVNKRMPRTHGESFIHVDKFSAMVYHDAELPVVDYSSDVDDESSATTILQVLDFDAYTIPTVQNFYGLSNDLMKRFIG